MARQRDHSSVYQRRVQIAKDAGYKSLRDYDRAKRVESETGDRPDSARVAELKANAQARAAAARRQVHDLGDKTLVTTTKRGKGMGVVSGQLAKHGTDPARLKVKLTDGRTVTVFQHGQRATAVRRIVDGGAGALADEVAKVYGHGIISASDIAGVSVELLGDWPYVWGDERDV